MSTLRAVDTKESSTRQAQAIVDSYGSIASSYDAFDSTPVVSRARSFVRESLLRRMLPGLRVLELNCGAGSDAIAFAQSGLHVVARDAVAGMIRIARQRAELADVNGRVNFDVLRNEDISDLQEREFNAVYSNFGGLNSTSNLASVFANAAGRLAPRGWMVICMLNRHALWETISFLFRGQWRAAFRRWGAQPKKVPLGSNSIFVNYYTPNELRRLLPPSMTVREVSGLSILSPPLGSTAFAERFPFLTSTLCAVDDVVRRLPLIRSFGDHFVLVAQRNS